MIEEGGGDDVYAGDGWKVLRDDRLEGGSNGVMGGSRDVRARSVVLVHVC